VIDSSPGQTTREVVAFRQRRPQRRSERERSGRKIPHRRKSGGAANKVVLLQGSEQEGRFGRCNPINLAARARHRQGTGVALC
jgi:hypothetical protein